jgi:hypothetical protein
VIRAGCLDGKPGLESSVRGIAVYLDTFAIKSLAKGDESLRQRFISALYDGADLLFSIANAVEISGAQGKSSQTVRAFLDDLGPNWYPIEMVPQVVIEREAAGLPPSKCCVADELLRAFFVNRTCPVQAGSSTSRRDSFGLGHSLTGWHLKETSISGGPENWTVC